MWHWRSSGPPPREREGEGRGGEGRGGRGGEGREGKEGGDNAHVPEQCQPGGTDKVPQSVASILHVNVHPTMA